MASDWLAQVRRCHAEGFGLTLDETGRLLACAEAALRRLAALEAENARMREALKDIEAQAGERWVRHIAREVRVPGP